MARGLRANPIRRGTRFVYARLAWARASEIFDTVCGADCARECVDDPGGREFYKRRRAGNVSKIIVVGGGAATGSVSLHVRRAVEDLRGCVIPERPIRPAHADFRRSERAGDHCVWDSAGILSRAADYFAFVLRGVDVWRHVVICGAGGIFLFCVWAAEGSPEAGRGGYHRMKSAARQLPGSPAWMRFGGRHVKQRKKGR